MMLNVKQVSKWLSVSPSKVYRLVERGEIPHHRIGGAIRFTEEQIAMFLENARREKPTKKAPRIALKLKHIRL